MTAVSNPKSSPPRAATIELFIMVPLLVIGGKPR
jgi:hypothetical protein